jgi:transposase
MARGRPLTELTLNGEDQETLTRWVRRPKTAQALAQRARIVLSAAEGRSNTAVAADLGVTARTVGKWRGRYVEQGPDGLLDEPRPGAPRTIGDDRVEAVIVKTLESEPKDATHWSTRSMARAMGMSQASIGRIWRAFGLQPHRSETFKLSTDPLFVEKVRDIVGLYLDPPERAVVLYVDEKSQIQALARFQPILPNAPGHARAAQPRLRPPRHHQPLRGTRARERQGHRLPPTASSRERVQEVPRAHRRRGS